MIPIIWEMVLQYGLMKRKKNQKLRIYNPLSNKMIKREPFELTGTEIRPVDTFTVKLNKEERAEFETFKYAIQQEKDSTALKQLAWVGAKVILSDSNKEIIKVILNNYRKNDRLGIIDFK